MTRTPCASCFWSSRLKSNWAAASGELQRLTGKAACEATIKRALVCFKYPAASTGITELIFTQDKTVRAASRKAVMGAAQIGDRRHRYLRVHHFV